MYFDALLTSLQGVYWAFYIILSLWWLFLPVVFLILIVNFWQSYTRQKYLDSLKWVMLRVKPPPLIDRSLKGMEQFFVNLHGSQGKKPNKRDRILRGKIRDHFSFEIVGNQGATEFYIRTLETHRNLIEANIFAQYPDAEIAQVEDYISELPKFLPTDEIDVVGGEMILAKNNAYPLLTYEYFQEKPGRKDDIPSLDPLASVAEAFSTYRPGEWFVMQFLLMPIAGDDWTKTARKEIDKVLGKEEKPKPNLFEKLLNALWELALGKPEEKKEEKKDKKLNPGEEDAVKGMEKKLARHGFQAGLRLMYIGPKEGFRRYHYAEIGGALKQFGSGLLNSFKPDKPTGTSSDGKLEFLFPSGKGLFAEQETFKKKVALYSKLRGREWTSHNFVLTTDELATLYHLPGPEVKAPLFPRVEAKMGQPPSNLELE